MKKNSKKLTDSEKTQTRTTQTIMLGWHQEKNKESKIIDSCY